MTKNSKIILDYLVSEFRKKSKSNQTDASLFKTGETLKNVNMEYDVFDASIQELKRLGYIKKWIIGIKLEVDRL